MRPRGSSESRVARSPRQSTPGRPPPPDVRTRTSQRRHGRCRTVSDTGDTVASLDTALTRAVASLATIVSELMSDVSCDLTHRLCVLASSPSGERLRQIDIAIILPLLMYLHKHKHFCRDASESYGNEMERPEELTYRRRAQAPPPPEYQVAHFSRFVSRHLCSDPPAVAAS